LYSPITDELVVCKPDWKDAERVVNLIVQHKSQSAKPKPPEQIVFEAV
jgi:hypothetical protein